MKLTKVQYLKCNHPHTILSAKDFWSNTTMDGILLVCFKCSEYCIVDFE